MHLFLTYRTKRAAKKYARELPVALKRDYGTTEHYTPAQIRATATRLHLNLKFIALAYAAFLEPEEFASLVDDMPICIPYDEGQAWYLRYKRNEMFSAAWSPIEPTPESLVGMTPP